MVKFGARLRDELRHEGWESHYIQYKSLKKVLKKVVQKEVEGSFVAATKLRLSFKKQLEEDIANVDSWFVELCSQLFQKGVRLAKIVEACLHEDYDANISVGKESVSSFSIVVMEEEKTETKEEADAINKTSEVETNDSAVVGNVKEEDDEKDTKVVIAVDEISGETSGSASLTNILQKKRSKSSIAREAIEKFVAFRREVKAIIKYASVNKEAVRKIVKKHDKNLGGNKYDSERLGPIMADYVKTKTEFSKERAMPPIAQALDLVNRLKTQILLKSSSFARYYESLLRSTELTKDENESSTNEFKSGGNGDQQKDDMTASTILDDNNSNDGSLLGTDETGKNITAAQPSIVPCPCGYELQWSIQRPDEYLQKLIQTNHKRQSDACGKYLPCHHYHHRKWTISTFVLIIIIFIGLIFNYGVQPERTQTLVYLGILGAVILSIANGANDIANSMGTSVGANALTLKKALVFGAIFEFFGAVTMGSSVAKTISKGVIDPNAYAGNCSGTLTFGLGMLCVLAGAGSTTLLATVYGLPISATHSIVGGLVAVGLAARGAESLGIDAIVKTMIAWVASPMLGAITAAIVHVTISKVIFEAENPEIRSIKMRPFFIVVAVSVCACFMLLKGPEFLKIEPTGLAIAIGISIGIVVSGLVSVYEHWCKKKNVLENESDDEDKDAIVVKSSLIGIAEDDNVGDNVELRDLDPTKETTEVLESATLPEDSAPPPPTITTVDNHLASTLSAPSSSSDKDNNEDEDRMKLKAKQREGAEKPFVPLLVLSALVVAFAHGGNDVGNAVGPLAVIVEAVDQGRVAGTPNIPLWALVIGASGFVIGIAILGERTISTVGGKITKLTPTKSFATQMGAAVAVLTSSVLGMPVSTSHCLVGAVVGIGIADRCMSGSGELNFNVLKKIFIGWAATIPLAMFVSVIVFWSLSPAFFDKSLNQDVNTTGLLSNETIVCR
jgi:phosphate/sulfate permease